MATTAYLPNAMQNFINSCSQTQITQLIQALQETQPRIAERAVPNAVSSMTAKAGVTTAKTGKEQRNKKAKSELATGGLKRPLNSWMAFRKYYNASLAPNTQKSISKVLTTWWHADPFEAKWAMLAKAYSILRGSREKEDVPLDDFFEICAPLIGVIPPEEYPQTMGWQLDPARADDGEKTPQLTRLFTPDLSTFPEKYTTTSLGVDDLVKYCYEVGYVRAGSDGTPKINASGSLTMAVQPTATEAANTRTTNGEQDSTMPPLSPSEVELNRALREVLSEPPASETALSNATTAINGSGGIYPYNTTFDPTSHFDISFNPNGLEECGAWDAFDVGLTGGNSIGGIDWNTFVHDHDLA